MADKIRDIQKLYLTKSARQVAEEIGVSINYVLSVCNNIPPEPRNKLHDEIRYRYNNMDSELKKHRRESIRILCDLYGTQPTRICKILGIEHISSIKDETVEKIIKVHELDEQGYTPAEISEITGYTKGAVYRYITMWDKIKER